MKRIRKAVFPVAGLGTRFLPATKSVPKEMLTVVDKPVIQHVVEEARAAGIEHFIFVTGRNKTVIEDHFDIAYELEATLRERSKTQALEELKETTGAHLPATSGGSQMDVEWVKKLLDRFTLGELRARFVAQIIEGVSVSGPQEELEASSAPSSSGSIELF